MFSCCFVPLQSQRCLDVENENVPAVLQEYKHIVALSVLSVKDEDVEFPPHSAQQERLQTAEL